MPPTLFLGAGRIRSLLIVRGYCVRDIALGGRRAPSEYYRADAGGREKESAEIESGESWWEVSKSSLSFDPARDAADLRAKKFRESIPKENGEPGGLYALYPRETIIANMRKLKGAERVYWGWVRYSWCYPISLPYAVEVDADENPIWHTHTGRWLPLSQKRLGILMGIGQSHMSEYTSELVRLGRLMEDDGATYVTFTLNVPEDPEGRTNGEGYPCTRIWGISLMDLPTLPKPVLNTLQLIFEAAQVPLGKRRVELAQPFFETRRECLDTWNHAREEEAIAYSNHTSDLCQELEVPPEALKAKASTNGNGNGHKPTASGQQREHKEDTEVRNEELYKAGAGKGALGKLPSERHAQPPREPSIAEGLLLGLSERGLHVELTFAETLARKMAPCTDLEFFFEVLDLDRRANERVHKPFTTTLLPSVAASVAVKYRDKLKAESAQTQRTEAARRNQQARRVAGWREMLNDPATPEKDKETIRELLADAGETVEEAAHG